MTLLYKLFGIPRNVDEFIEYAKDSGQRCVVLKFVEDVSHYAGISAEGEVVDNGLYVELATDKTNLRVLKIKRKRWGNIREEENTAIRENARGKVKRIIEKLEENHLGVLIRKCFEWGRQDSRIFEDIIAKYQG